MSATVKVLQSITINLIAVVLIIARIKLSASQLRKQWQAEPFVNGSNELAATGL